jgi:hypothetical protein
MSLVFSFQAGEERASSLKRLAFPMKTTSRFLSLPTLLAFATLILPGATGCGKEAPAGPPPPPAPKPRIVSAVTNSFYAVTPHLDPGGSFYLYVDTAPWLAGLSAKVAGWQTFLTSLPDMGESDKTVVNQVFRFITRLIQTSGLEEISGVGASGVLRENNLYYNKFILHHYPGRGEGLLWSMYGKTPHSLEALDFLPASTVLASGSDLDLAMFWGVIQREVQESDAPQAAAFLQQFTTNFEAKAGLPLDRLLASLPGPLLFALTLDETRQVQLPLGSDVTLKMPEPGLALMIRTKDDALFGLVEKLLPQDTQLVRVDKPGLKMRTLPLPLPLPIPLRPTIAQTDEYVFVATHERVVEEMLAVKAGQAPGLKSTDELKELSADIALEGNGFGFQSRRFGKALNEALRSAVAASGKQQTGPPPELWQRLFNLESVAFSVSRNTPEGWLVTANGSDHPASVIVAPALAAPAAIAAGMLLPALAKAKSKAQSINCVSNLKQIGLAARLYANDHGDVFPKDFVSMKNELPSPKVLFCPNDPAKPGTLPSDWSKVDPERFSYEFVAPGAREDDPRRVVFRCRIHGHVCHADGSVEQRPK